MGVTAAVGRSWLCAETGERERRAECDLDACRSPTLRQTSAPVTMVKKPRWFRSTYLVLAGPLDITLPDPGISPTSAECLRAHSTQGPSDTPTGSGQAGRRAFLLSLFSLFSVTIFLPLVILTELNSVLHHCYLRLLRGFQCRRKKKAI